MNFSIKKIIKEYVSTVRIKTVAEDLTNWAFILVVMNGFFLMFRIDLKLTVLLVLVSSITILKRVSLVNSITYSIWGCYVLLCIFTIFANTYPKGIVYYALRYQFWGMLFFLIGISKVFANRKLLENMRFPIFMACFIGFYLYFYNPSWYNNFRYARVNQYTAMDFLRFSSFWSYSYVIAYLSGIYSTYCIVKMLKGEHNNFTYLGYIVSLAAVVLSQQRAVMGFSALVFLFANIYLIFKSGSVKFKRWLFAVDVVIFVGAVIFIHIVYNSLDTSTIEYGLGKLESMVNSDQLVSERLSMFQYWIDKPFPIFGDGFGRYSHEALTFNLPAITDCEYLKIIHETGVIGLILFMIIIIRSLVNGIRYSNCYLFEMLIVIMYSIAMIGADPISSDLMQPWFFWFCVGRLNNPYVIRYERRIDNNRKLQHTRTYLCLR